MSVVQLLDEIADTGRDRRTGGYRRFAFTAQDATLGEWFEAACAARGLTTTVDRCGNQWAWWGDPDAARHGGVVTGSHLDSVPDGGNYDGPLGVAAALAAVDLLQAKGFRPARPIGLVRFLDEEGGRFGMACSGSRLVSGQTPAEQVLALRDDDGVGYAEAMRSAGLDPAAAGADPETIRRIGVFVELHVEQGRGLVHRTGSAGAVGVAEAIRAHGRWRVDLRGRADHAGATRLEDRDDPMLELARLIPAVRESARRHGLDPAGVPQGTVATVGRVQVHPNAVNAIPGLVRAWLDVRSDTEQVVRAVLADLAAEGFPIVEESFSPPVAMDRGLRDRLAAVVGGALTGDPLTGEAAPPPAPAQATVLPTGAGHDAGILAVMGVPAGMLFVRNPTGVSHSPAEHAEDDDCRAGAVALAAVLADLAGEAVPR